MSNRLGIAVIGCGMMGKAHGRVWAGRDDAEVRMVFDVDPSRAATMAKEYGATVGDSWEAAIGASDIEAVSVCTPVCHHPEIAIAAANAGKHVLCEKPIALTLNDAQAMESAARQAGTQLMTSYQYRGRSRYRLYRQWVEEQVLSGPIMARFVDIREVRPKTAMHRESMNGGPVIDMTGHFFDLMRFITGEEPQTVFASGHTFGRGKARLAGIDDLAIDAAEIQVRFTGGHVLSVHVHWGLPEGAPAYSDEYLVTAEALVRTENNQVLLNLKDQQTTHDPGPDSHDPIISVGGLVDAISGRQFSVASAHDGYVALRVSLAALESIKTGSVIDLAYR